MGAQVFADGRSTSAAHATCPHPRCTGPRNHRAWRTSVAHLRWILRLDPRHGWRLRGPQRSRHIAPVHLLERRSLDRRPTPRSPAIEGTPAETAPKEQLLSVSSRPAHIHTTTSDIAYFPTLFLVNNFNLPFNEICPVGSQYRFPRCLFNEVRLARISTDIHGNYSLISTPNHVRDISYVVQIIACLNNSCLSIFGKSGHLDRLCLTGSDVKQRLHIRVKISTELILQPEKFQHCLYSCRLFFVQRARWAGRGRRIRTGRHAGGRKSRLHCGRRLRVRIWWSLGSTSAYQQDHQQEPRPPSSHAVLLH